MTRTISSFFQRLFPDVIPTLEAEIRRRQMTIGAVIVALLCVSAACTNSRVLLYPMNGDAQDPVAFAAQTGAVPTDEIGGGSGGGVRGPTARYAPFKPTGFASLAPERSGAAGRPFGLMALSPPAASATDRPVIADGSASRARGGGGGTGSEPGFGGAGAPLSIASLTPLPDPLPGGTGAVPEPATWLMMILGFGLVGAGLRTARRDKPGTRAAFA